MKNTTENIVRETLIKKYHEFGFARYTGSDLKFLACEIEILEELVSEICEAKGIDTKEFILESQLDGIGIKEGE
ncbi:hypothetical protein QI059_00990 [Staphylococcus saprophyticus]|nr:hypothetical protein [Staphylococcus saprophyticus]MDW4036081.1 hypothetical protein [Staphylococcus saprophyticus]MDW4295921.1 hypothetical protein [Staphylococcus saprophyticus]